MNARSLTVAFIAIGAEMALLKNENRAPDGWLGYISEVIFFAPIVDAALTNHPDKEDYTGVHPYDVALPFGETVGLRLLMGDIVTEPDARQLASDLVAKGIKP